MKRELKQSSASGGIAQASKIGLRNSVAYIRGMDIRSDPSEIRRLPGSVYHSSPISIPGTTDDAYSPQSGSGDDTVDGYVQRIVDTTSSLLLYDNFNDNSINTSLWTTSGTVLETSNALRVYAVQNGGGKTSSADTNDKTSASPPGEPITEAQFDWSKNAWHSTGFDMWAELTNGTDYIRLVHLGDVQDMIVRLGGTFGSGDQNRWTSMGGTFHIVNEGSDIKIYEGTTLRQTITGKSMTSGNNLYFRAYASTGNKDDGSNIYGTVDNAYFNGSAASSETWATIRAGAGTTQGKSETSGKAVLLKAGATSNYDEMGRSIFTFDTSPIPTGATVNSASFKIYVTNKVETLASQQVVLTNAAPTADNDLAIGDYANTGSTAWCTAVNIADLTVGQYNSIALNATGVAGIDLAGVTAIGMRLEADRGNADPTAGAGTEASVTVQFADGANPPILAVNYTVTSPDETSTRDLVKWIVPGTPHDTNTYYYDASGNIYRESLAGALTLLRTVANSNGQGAVIFNDYLYYTQNTQLGRYGPLSGTPAFDDDYLIGLNATSDFAPIIQFLDYIAVCHGREVKKVYGTESTGADIGTADLNLPIGYKIRCAAQVGEFLGFGGWRGTSINDVDTGKIFLWDGTAAQYNIVVDVPEGAVNAMTSLGGALLYVAGNKGSMLAWDQGPLGRIWQVPKQETGDYLEVWPGAMTVWQALLHVGVAANTNSSTIKHGVYAYGTRDPRLFPPALSHDYWMSSNDISGSTLKIGAVLGQGSRLVYSFKDSSGRYGIDRVPINGAPSTYDATIEWLRFDNDDISRNKTAGDYILTHEALASGDVIKMKKDTNRSGTYTEKDDNLTIGDTRTTYALNGEFEEIDLAVDIVGNPVLTGMKFEYDDQIESRKP